MQWQLLSYFPVHTLSDASSTICCAAFPCFFRVHVFFSPGCRGGVGFGLGRHQCVLIGFRQQRRRGTANVYHLPLATHRFRSKIAIMYCTRYILFQANNNLENKRPFLCCIPRPASTNICTPDFEHYGKFFSFLLPSSFPPPLSYSAAQPHSRHVDDFSGIPD